MAVSRKIWRGKLSRRWLTSNAAPSSTSARIASALMGSEMKSQWENKICGCVSEEAPANMTNQEMLQVINPATRNQAVANVAVKTVGACIKRVLR